MHRRSHRYCTSLVTLALVLAPSGAQAATRPAKHHHLAGATSVHAGPHAGARRDRLHLGRLHLGRLHLG